MYKLILLGLTHLFINNLLSTTDLTVAKEKYEGKV